LVKILLQAAMAGGGTTSSAIGGTAVAAIKFIGSVCDFVDAQQRSFCLIQFHCKERPCSSHSYYKMQECSLQNYSNGG
jgi:hypothetical protein